MRLLCVVLLVLVATASPILGQTPGDRQKARIANKTGWDLMKAEAFEKAVIAFQQSIELDPTFEMSFYGLGRAHLALKQFVSAISALSRCRDLYIAQVGRQFSNQQEAQRYRQDRITELDDMIRQLQSAPQSVAVQDQLRQVQEQKRQIQEFITRGNNSMTITSGVPAWVSLSLGSALFRSGKLADAETEYKAAISTDPRSGEAHNNLAVVYLETNRVNEALASINAAKKTGFKVNPELEQAIRERAK
jgi:tetratricopeptide (TPR) repeat protein